MAKQPENLQIPTQISFKSEPGLQPNRKQAPTNNYECTLNKLNVSRHVHQKPHQDTPNVAKQNKLSCFQITLKHKIPKTLHTTDYTQLTCLTLVYFLQPYSQSTLDKLKQHTRDQYH